MNDIFCKDLSEIDSMNEIFMHLKIKIFLV